MRVIGYVRVSTGRQAKQGTSLQGQEERIRAWAKFNGADEVTIFSDNGKSGWRKNWRKKRRPGVEAALAALGPGDTLATYSLSRIGRSARDLLDLADVVRAKGADLVSMCEPVSTKGAAGQMFFTVLAAMCQYQSDMHSERVTDMWHDKKSKGERPGGPYCPFGYTARGKMLVKVPDEQRVIRRVRAWRRRGMSLRMIGRRLEAQDVRRKAGGVNWNAPSVNSLLRTA